MIGMTPADAGFASSFRELGAICAVVYLGVLIDRVGAERALALHYAAGISFIALIALVALPYLLLVAVIFFSGMTIIGSQTGANAACGKLYPARMRTSGLGWALGIGRLGAAPRRVSAAERRGAAAYLPQRLPVCSGRRGGDGTAALQRQPRGGAHGGEGRTVKIFVPHQGGLRVC
jgi:nitrate/nitrite transporter NarK